MSIQEQPVCYNIPGQTTPSSIVINRGNEEYDPFTVDEEDLNESEQSKNQKQESIRINNGSTIHSGSNNTNGSTNEQEELQRKSKSPVDHHNNHSDHRSRSPSHNNNYSSDRKRPRPSSPNSSSVTTVNNNDSSSTSETISSLKHKKSYRNDDRKRSKHYHRHRSNSLSRSPSPLSNNNKRTCDSKDDRSSSSSYNRSSYRTDKRDDHYPHRSRNYSSSKYSSSTHQQHNDRRTNTNYSSPPRLASKIIAPEANSSHSTAESNPHETTTEDRNKIYNRLKSINDPNASTSPLNNSNKTSSTGSSFVNSNGGSQRSRSNLIQIMTTEATPGPSQTPPVRISSPQVKSESTKPPSIPAKLESKVTTTTDSVQSTKTNGNKADDMLMEEMLLEEEQEKSPIKPIDLDSLTIPEAATKKSDTTVQEPTKTDTTTIIPTITTATVISTTITTTTTISSSVTSAPSLTPSPTKKPYTLYKVPHTNHMTPPMPSRHKKQTKKESSTTQSDSTATTPTITNKSIPDDNSQRTSLDERISTLLGVSSPSSTKPTNSSNEQQSDTKTNQITRTSTPSDKSTESPQEIPLLISAITKKPPEHTSLTRKLSINEERRSSTSKHYTSEWLASQKPEEASTEEIMALPSLISLPTLVSSQPSSSDTKSSTTTSNESLMLGKLSEAMSKLIQKQSDTTLPPTNTEADDTVPISAKHLERLERRKQREKLQSQIAAIAKEALKPAFRKHDITKDEYKEIMKKVVTKATHADEVDRGRISKMIDAYVEKYRKIRQHNTAKSSNKNSS